jgi:hypothetical protein
MKELHAVKAIVAEAAGPVSVEQVMPSVLFSETMLSR